MMALPHSTIGAPPEVVEIETPEPGPGQVRLRVTAAGVCHSDDFIMSLPADQFMYGSPRVKKTTVPTPQISASHLPGLDPQALWLST